MVKEAPQVLLGRYRLMHSVGTGGMGFVLKARDEVLERDVAVKLLRESLTDDESSVLRFRREARIAAGLTHPGIAQIFDFGEEDGQPFIVMEYLDGENLHSRVKRDGPMHPAEAALVAANVADALQHAHASGAVHRDVKPGNIFITKDGQVKLTDFGIATSLSQDPLTSSGSVLGTHLYIAPEQVSGEGATPSSDIYALGCVLHELLIGKPPFEAETPLAVAMAHVSSEPPDAGKIDPSIPAALAAVVSKAMAKVPADRYSSAGEMSGALRMAVASADTTPTPNLAVGVPADLESTIVLAESAGPQTPIAWPAPAAPAGREPTLRTRPGLSRSLIALLVLAGVIGLVLVVMQFVDPPRSSFAMPQLVGLTADDAEREAKELGLEPVSRAEPADAPIGEVVTQDPPQGAQVRSGSTVTLVVASGKVTVPSVIGQPVEAARGVLEAKNLQVVIDGDEGGDAVVVAQDPEASTAVDQGSVITLTGEKLRNRGRDKDNDNEGDD